MMSQPSRNSLSRATRLAAVLLAGLSLSLGACGKKKKPAPPPPPPPEPTVVIPDPVDINGIMADVKPDGRVKFPEKNAPADAELAQAVIEFASNFAKGDAAAVQGNLAPESRAVLDSLVADGAWSEETGKIEQVRIVQLSPLQETDVQRATVVMAIQAPGGAYPLAWEAKRDGSGWIFKSLTTEDKVLARASDFDNQSVRYGSSAMASSSSANDSGSGSDERDGTPEEDPATTGEPVEKDDGPIKKQTPGGPIEIPRAPGSGSR